MLWGVWLEVFHGMMFEVLMGILDQKVLIVPTILMIVVVYVDQIS